MSNVALQFYNVIPSFWNSDSSKVNNLANNDILDIGNALSGIFLENKTINLETPQLVVIGNQSSGKSSVLNNIIQMDILPTGSNMVTRTPLNLQLSKSNDKPRIEFGYYDNGTWINNKKILLTYPEPLPSEKHAIQNEIETLTCKIAGNNKNVSSTPIILKIFHPNIPNLSLIDLPGLTMVACTDQGQPKNIKELIRNMLVEYIEKERTLILCVMPARTDLEADPALDLVKEYDPEGKRTIGILTKIDLMNENTDVSRYLSGNISKDLQLGYGYYAVKNRSPSEMKTMDIYEGLKNEKEFFKNHPVYSKHSSEKFGINNVSNRLSDILVQHIKKTLPSILNEISIIYNDVYNNYIRLGEDVPMSLEGKTGLVHSISSDYCQEFKQTINSKKSKTNIGRNIKDTFIKYRENILMINPFNIKDYDNEYIENSIKDCVGNHMSVLTSPIEVLEHCLSDKNKKPFSLLVEPSLECVTNISTYLYNLNKLILEDNKYSRFPNLCLKIKEIVDNEIIKKNILQTNKLIMNIIEMEEKYIWTDDDFFLNTINQMLKNNNDFTSSDNIRKLLETYFKCIEKNINNNIPKIIMMFLVKKTEEDLSSVIFENILKSDISKLIEEEDNVKELRNKYSQQLEKLNSAKKYIEKSL